MGLRVGENGTVSGIDLSDSMVTLAQRRCASLAWVDFRVGNATSLPYADGVFDVATATQVYNYVSDLSTTLRELYRVLRPAGRALILETDWDTLIWNTSDSARMRRILAAWVEHAAHPYLPRTLAPELRNAGFQITEQAVFPLFNPKYDPNTYSHGLIDFIASFVTDRQGITAEEAQAWANELRQRGQVDDYFFSLNRYMFLAVKPEALDSTSS